MIFNFKFGRKQKGPREANALADLRVGESAIVSDIELAPPLAEHLMNLGMVPGLEVTVTQRPWRRTRVYRVGPRLPCVAIYRAAFMCNCSEHPPSVTNRLESR